MAGFARGLKQAHWLIHVWRSQRRSKRWMRRGTALSGRPLALLYNKFTRKEQASSFAWLFKGKSECLGFYKDFEFDFSKEIMTSWDFPGPPRTS